MTREDILSFLQRHAGEYTTSQIALRINRSNGRVHTVLMELWDEGIVNCEVVTEPGTYRQRRYMVWSLA